MAMRLSGLISGMDTDAMIEELVSAYSKKKDNIYKDRKTLEYKQDAWKELNGKIYSFYTGSLGNMQLTSNYNLKTSVSSDEAKATVTSASSAVNGTQELKVTRLSKTAYLTGGQIKTDALDDEGNPVEITAATKLSTLGIDDASIRVTVAGEEQTIDLNGNMTIKELKEAFQETGLNANYDEVNGRFFISSKTGGEENDFTIEGVGKAGSKALTALGLNMVSETAIEGYRAIAALDLQECAKSDYIANILIAKKEEVNQQIGELTAKETDGTITEDEKNTLAELKAQTEDIGELIKERDFTNMETYVKDILGETPDYSDANSEYMKYVDDYNNQIAYAEDQIAYAELFEKMKTTVLTETEKQKYAELVEKYGEIYSEGAVKIDGQDAIIELNGAEFRSNSNTLIVNGLTINVKATTDEDEIITLTTDTDVDAIYDKIKGFFKEYNELMKEMSTKYNAPSAGDYEPLTEEEEEELSETQLEKWEKILTTAALRRDGSLNSVMSGMKNTMMKSYEINGKQYSLSSFGIKTLSYFTAEENEKGSFHIDGDKDDSNTAGNEDKLRAALVSDTENTIEFFSTIMRDLYQNLNEKMATSTATHSAFKLYNDKTMQSQYDQYTKKLEQWEDKIEDYRDKYVKKFSNMETAMAKLQSQTSALSSFFGTGM